jgi:hypothetical protein
VSVMAVSAVLIRPRRTARTSLVAGALALAAALGGSEAAYYIVGPFWGAVCFAVTFLTIVECAVLVSTRRATDRQLMALLVAASLVPLNRLLMLSSPVLPFLRLYPNALWILPMGLVSVYAYRARWLLGTTRPPLRLPGPGRRPLAVQTAVAAAGAGLGVLGAFALPYTGPHALIFPDAAKWTGVALFALTGGVGELAWRGVLQPIAADAAGPIGVATCFVTSAYISVAWMGFSAAVPVIVLSGLTSVVVYRTRCLSGALAGGFLLSLLLAMLR